ncbi:MAG: hypothetical protein KGJ02_02870 [Verrucomicrobiota bacterium]|nr:hypothetical protein [Verrucomicrobiota bacterium]
MKRQQEAGLSQWIGWWWVVAFCLFAAVIYIPAMKSRKVSLDELSFRLSEMEKEKRLALQEKEELSLRITSQNDPAWVELVLLREMGVVPEGFLKVHFKK